MGAAIAGLAVAAIDPGGGKPGRPRRADVVVLALRNMEDAFALHAETLQMRDEILERARIGCWVSPALATRFPS